MVQGLSRSAICCATTPEALPTPTESPSCPHDAFSPPTWRAVAYPDGPPTAPAKRAFASGLLERPDVAPPAAPAPRRPTSRGQAPQVAQSRRWLSATLLAPRRRLLRGHHHACYSGGQCLAAECATNSTGDQATYAVGCCPSPTSPVRMRPEPPCQFGAHLLKVIIQSRVTQWFTADA